MKRLLFKTWMMVVLVVLAACSQVPAPQPQQKVVIPEGIKFVEGNSGELSAQAEPYNITVRYGQEVPTLVRNAVSAAKFRWERVITQGLPSLNTTYDAGECINETAYSGTIDDVQIEVRVIDIDGPGGRVALGGTCFVRAGNLLTNVGYIVFDSSDLTRTVAASLISNTTHELGHALGFIDEIFELKGLIQNSGSANPAFLGQNAKREYNKLGGKGLAPLEPNDEDHWRVSVFDNELMVAGKVVGRRPLSRVTIAAMQDLGYSVDYTKADAFSLD